MPDDNRCRKEAAQRSDSIRGAFKYLAPGIACAIVLGFASAGAVVPQQPASVSGQTALARISSQRDRLAKPELGRGWHTFAARYSLAKSTVSLVRGKRLRRGKCDFINRLTLAPHEKRRESRARAVNLSECLAVVEVGIPPARAPSGSSSNEQPHALSEDDGPAGEAPDPDEVKPSECGVDGVYPYTDCVLVPSAGAEVDPIDDDPSATSGADPDEHEGLYWSRGEYHSWYEDPIGINVAQIWDTIAGGYPFGGGCVQQFFSSAHWQWYEGWGVSADNHKHGKVCGYAYQSSYMHFRNGVFCRVFIWPFAKATHVYFNRNTIRVLGNGTLKGIVHSSVSGGCSKLLSFHSHLERQG
jgi:hypothetical protein